MDKPQARSWAKARRKTLDQQALGSAMAQALLALPAWQQANAVLCFAALPDEPDTTPILRAALAQGKQLFLPRVAPERALHWVPVTDLAALQRSSYGILEPTGEPAPLPEQGVLGLIPCLAASPQGVRLGRGGGYYDRFLPQFRGNLMLLCPTALLAEDLPCEAWDFRFAPQQILTEHGLLG